MGNTPELSKFLHLLPEENGQKQLVKDVLDEFNSKEYLFQNCVEGGYQSDFNDANMIINKEATEV